MKNGWTNKPWIAAFSILRPLNLLFIALTQYLLFFHFIFPLLHSAGAPVVLSGWRAWAFLLATTLVAGAGYAINDLYDIEGDRINKPGKWILGREISFFHAKLLIALSIGGGAALSALIALDIQAAHLWVLYPTAVFSLWAYSRYLKGTPLAGNLLVAALCALVAGIVWFAERRGFAWIAERNPELAGRAAEALAFYLGFAFLANLFREIVKDCEDVKGDSLLKKYTLPVAGGLKMAKWIAFSLGLLLEAALLGLTARFFFLSGWTGLVFSLLMLIIPLGWGLVFLARAEKPQDFTPVSRIAKWVIFAGVFLIVLLP